MYAAIVWFDDGITVIKNEDEAGLLKTVSNVLVTGQEGWHHGIIKEGFDDELSSIMAMEEIDDYETVADDLVQYLDPAPDLSTSEVFNHNR